MEGLRRCTGKLHVYEDGRWKDKEFELGYFHGWGMNYEEFETGPGNYSVAIVELPDGSVITPAVTDITFLDTVNEGKEARA